MEADEGNAAVRADHDHDRELAARVGTVARPGRVPSPRRLRWNAARKATGPSRTTATPAPRRTKTTS